MCELTRTVRSALLAATLAPLVFAAAAARADTITVPFTITLNTSPTGIGLTYLSSNIAQFNPTQGTLVDVQMSLTGSAIWSSVSMPPTLLAELDGRQLFVLQQRFVIPGTINFSFSGTSTDPLVLAFWTGTGTSFVDLSFAGRSLNDTIQSAGSAPTGTFKFDFTPAAAVPEPSTWAMMLIGFAGLGFAFRQSRRRVSFA